ncbi:TPA: IclR family transcriptional regulator [Clostridioides difficile]|nr:IclR family transcriptional regulator [Clostridioides difficile]
MTSDNHRPTARILDILEALAESENGYTLTEIAEVINAPKSSIFPIVHTLNARKYITIDKNTSKYSIGIRSYTLGSSFFEKRTIFNYIIDEMTNIVNSCSETCQLGILDNNEVLYIGKVDSPEPIRLISYVGKKIPANCTGLGKALLCDFDKEKLISLYPDGLKGFTEKSITDFDVLYDQLLEVQRTQIASECEESMEHLKCLAVPIRKNGCIRAAVSVTLPLFRANDEKIELIKKLLLNAQKNIQSMMEERNEDIVIN